MSIQNLITSLGINVYKNKLNEFNVSSSLLDSRINSYSAFSIINTIKQASNKTDFNNLISSEIFSEKYACNYYDFSLLMGLCFGVYNLYGFVSLSPELKIQCAKSNLNYTDTMYILNNYKEDFDFYFKTTYGINSDELKIIIDKMKTVCNNDQLFNSDVAIDVGKTIVGIKIKYMDFDLSSVNKNQIKDEIRNGEYINYFNEVNSVNRYSNYKK